MDPIGDGDGGDREEAKNQSLDLRQHHDDVLMVMAEKCRK